MIKKIISGGQTGADQAALDFALKTGIEHGGWIPRGRLTELGPLNNKYKLQETKSDKYEERTEKNVLSADATLIFCRGQLSGGSLYTLILTQKHKKPAFVVDLDLLDKKDLIQPTLEDLRRWILRHNVQILNIAGPRASKDLQIYSDVKKYLKNLFKASK